MFVTAINHPNDRAPTANLRTNEDRNATDVHSIAQKAPPTVRLKMDKVSADTGLIKPTGMSSNKRRKHATSEHTARGKTLGNQKITVCKRKNPPDKRPTRVILE